jgi:hypothetical protein
MIEGPQVLPKRMILNGERSENRDYHSRTLLDEIKENKKRT